jgi:hypothetical protein
MPLASFLAGTIGKSILGGAMSAVASRLLQPKISKPRIDFKGMRDDAEAAGFNPLTAMRSGAISGYMIPALSKQSFVGQFLSGAIRAGTDAFLNKDIDAYNAELRKLNLQEKKANIGYTGLLSKQIIGNLGRSPKLPPESEKHNFVLDSANQFVLDDEGYPIRRDKLTEKQTQSIYSTAGQDGNRIKLKSVNTEILDASLPEAAGSAAIIGGGAVAGAALTQINKGVLPNANKGALSAELFKKIEDAIMPELVPFRAPLSSRNFRP